MDLPSTPSNILWIALKDLAGFGISDYRTIVTYSKPTKKKAYAALTVFHSFAIIFFIATGLWWVPALWYASLVTSFIMFFRLRLWLEHHGTDYTHRLKLNRWQGALLAPHLSWHHWEHHYWPSIPYYNLPQLRAMIPEVPVMTLGELLSFYKSCGRIDGGAALKPSSRKEAGGVQNPAFN